MKLQEASLLGGFSFRCCVAVCLFAVSCAIGPPVEWPEQRTLRAADGFVVERVYGVPRGEQGSWISLTVDSRGRLIASDETGGLYRLMPAPIGAPESATHVEALELEYDGDELGHAHGLLYAFDSLYVIRSEGFVSGHEGNGVYRARDLDGDDRFETVELLRPLGGFGEHGPHQLVVAPDGASLVLIAGNDTAPTDFARSRFAVQPREDQLLPVMPNWLILNLPPPGGWIAQLDPDGREWELLASGFRNPYDLAFSRAGDLFAYDADMEWDIGAPWYRPTRLLHARSGGDFGWRKGSGKWPAEFPDSLGAVVDVGTGSPTGIAFGYGAAFPARYQEALYLQDWSHGKIYAAHLEPAGSSYRAELESFVVGQPLPVTDLVVNPRDRAMYFSTGGRGAESGIYRVRYVGAELVPEAETVASAGPPNEEHALRRRLEALHVPGGAPEGAASGTGAVEAAWPQLAHPDRGIRYAARVALEHQPLEEWRARALAETSADTAIGASLALARVGTASDQDAGLRALLALRWEAWSPRQQRDVYRTLAVWLSRHGVPPDPLRSELVARLEPFYPSGSFPTDRALSELVIFLEAPSAIERTLGLLENAPSQEEQIHFGSVLRVVDDGWTREQRDRYFAWLGRARDFDGGQALGHFIEIIEDDARDHVPFGDGMRLSRIARAAQGEAGASPAITPPRGPGREWTLAEIEPLLAAPLGGRNFERGEQMFGAGACFTCHRFAGRGGAVGPDLSAVGTRFRPLEIAESILDPGRIVSDQYRTVEIRLKDGEVIHGRIVNLMGNMFGLRTEGFVVSTDMLSKQERRIAPGSVESIEPSETSMMPGGLVNAMNEDEFLDLIAYLVSGGDPEHRTFR